MVPYDDRGLASGGSLHQFADHALTSRLEALSAEEMRRFVETARASDPYSDAALLEVAGGVAVYLGEGSPVNQAIGLGLQSTAVTAEDARALHSFYADREQQGVAVLSPFVDRSLLLRMADLGWRLDGFENVLVRAYEAHDRLVDVQSDVDIRVIDTDEGRAVWAHVAAVGFSAPLEPPASHLALSRVVADRPGTTLLMAFVDGRPAGTGELYVQDSIAWLSADATLPEFRRRGVQRALQLARLKLGAERGCELAVTESSPGSGSQRNMERLGFRVAYTRVDLVSPPVLQPGPHERTRHAE